MGCASPHELTSNIYPVPTKYILCGQQAQIPLTGISLCSPGHQVTIWRGNLSIQKRQVPPLAPRPSCSCSCSSILLFLHRSGVEDDLRDLPVLHARPVVVAGGVAELEGDLAPVMAVHSHLAESLGAVVAVEALQGAHRGVVGVGLDLQRLLEHRTEGRVGS